MGPVVPILRLGYLFLNIYDTYKVLKPPPPSPRNGGQPSARAMTQRKRDMKGIMTIWIVWCCIATYEKAVDPLIIYFPFYDEIKSIFILFFIFTRARGAEPVYLHVIRHLIKPHTHTIDTLLETIHLFGDFLVVLTSWPAQAIYAWFNGLTFNFPWNSSMADEDLQSVSSDESRPQSSLKQRPQAHIRQRSTISTAVVQDAGDGFGAHQIWYPPPPAYEEEDHSQVRPPPIPVTSPAPGVYPSTRGPDEWRQYPNFPAAYPLSPVLDSAPPPGFRIVAPVPKRPSDVIDIDNMSNSDQNDGNESAGDETRPGFRGSLLSLREFPNPDSAERSSDKNPTYGVRPDGRVKNNKRKRKQIASEGREEDSDEEEDGMNLDEESGGENTPDDDEEMDEDGSEDEGRIADETFTTPKVRTVAVDSDAEMGDASASEPEDSFGLQTPLPRCNGKRTRSNITIKRPSSTATLNPRKNGQGAGLKIHPTSLLRPFPPHIAPQLSATNSGSSAWSASTTLSTLGGGDSLMTGDGSEREELETPLSPRFPSPVTYGVDNPPFSIPDADPTLTVPNVRGKRLFHRSNATSTRSRPRIQGMAITSSSSGGANSCANSRSRGNRKSQGLQPSTKRKNTGGPGQARTARPAAKGAENVPTTMPMPFPIPVSDPDDVQMRKPIKGLAGTGREKETHSDAPSLSKKQKITPAYLRKTSSLGSKPPPRRRPAAPQEPIRIMRSTSSGTSASSSNVGARKKAGLTRNDKPTVRITRIRNGGVVDADESGG